jgi:hypothetical protein
MTTDHDIIPRLLAAAEDAPDEIGALLEEAAIDIEALRMLVGVGAIGDEIELMFVEPAGNA